MIIIFRYFMNTLKDIVITKVIFSDQIIPFKYNLSPVNEELQETNIT